MHRFFRLAADAQLPTGNNQHIDFFLYMLYHDRKKAGEEK